jgi:hypothetical protein
VVKRIDIVTEPVCWPRSDETPLTALILSGDVDERLLQVRIVLWLSMFVERSVFEFDDSPGLAYRFMNLLDI